MPITGHFEADFSAFNEGVKEANTALGGLITQSKDTGAALDQMGTTAPAAMKETTKEVKTTTASFIDMGGVVKQIGGIIAGAFTVQSIISFGKEVLNSADAIVKMSAQTGLTIEQVQQLQYVSGQTSVSMQSMVGAMQSVTERLGSGDAGLNAALLKLNINLDDFKRMDTFNQFLTLAGAIGDVKDPTIKASDAAAVFLKNWKEVFPLLNQQMHQLANDATVVADKTVKTVQSLGDRITAAGGRLTSWGSIALAGTMDAIENVAGGYVELGNAMLNWRNGFETTGQMLDRYGRENLASAANSADRFTQSLTNTLPPALRLGGQLGALKLTVDQLKDAEKAHSTETADSMAAHKAQVDAEKAAYASLAEEFRKQQADLDALIGRMKGDDVVAAAEQWAKAMRAMGEDVSKLSSKMRDELGTTMREAIEAMARNGTLTSDQALAYGRLLAKVDEYNASLKKQAEVILPAASGAVTDYTMALYKQAQAQDAANLAAAGVAGGAGSNVGGTDATNPDYTAPSGNVGGPRYQQAPTGQAPQQGYEKITTTSGSGAGSSYYTPAPPTRAAGGPVAAGTSYLVGEQGPELFTPGSSGGITPNGAGGPVVQNTFHLVDTESNLARKVSDLIMRSVLTARRV